MSSKGRSDLVQRLIPWIIGAALFSGGPLVAEGAGDAGNRSMVLPRDEEIESALESKLIRAMPLWSRDVEVSCSDRIVTLSGSVDNLLASQRLVELAGVLRGVRGVVDRIEVAPSALVSDAELRRRVTQAIQSRVPGDGTRVDVRVDEGRVAMTGTAPSFVLRDLAGSAARAVAGVRAVSNDVKVVPETDRDPETIRLEIMRRLEADPWLTFRGIEVSMEGRDALLQGSVASLWERSRAERLAWIPGVGNVISAGVRIQPGIATKVDPPEIVIPSDDEIRQTLVRSLELDPRVDHRQIEVEVKEGDVYLWGTATRLEQAFAAEDDARNLRGASRVFNFISLRKAPPRTDRALEEMSRKVLRHDPLLDGRRLRVRAEDARVIVTGEVESRFEQRRVGEVIAKIPGVYFLTNLTTIDSGRKPAAGEELKELVEIELYWTPHLDAREIEVSVADRLVTLGGSVLTHHQRRAAVECAYEAGALYVQDEIHLDLPGAR